MPTTRFDGPVPDPADPEVQRISRELGGYFPPELVKWKPQAVKGTRAMAIAYIDARTVLDRLDIACGVAGWQDRYELLADGSVVCSLGVAFGGRWVVKDDVGSPSEQPDGGDRLKAAFSDALKRAAIKFGVGRYLYRLPQQWYDYDPQKRQFATIPQLPAWAIPPGHQAAVKSPGPAQRPAPSSSPPPAASPPPVKEPAKLAAGESGRHGHGKPKTGEELDRRVREYDAKLSAEGLCRPGSLVLYVEQWGESAGYGEHMTGYGPQGIQYAIDAVKTYEDTRRTEKRSGVKK